MPPQSPPDWLRRLRLSPEEVRGYYIETANRAPLAIVPPQIARLMCEEEHWKTYRRVNEARRGRGDHPRPRVARQWSGSRTITSPAFPPCCAAPRGSSSISSGTSRGRPADILRLCRLPGPWCARVLGNDLLGFQTKSDCRNFFAAVRRFVPGEGQSWDTAASNSAASAPWSAPFRSRST